MNRRSFLFSIPFLGVALKAMCARDDTYRCVITPITKTYQLRSIEWPEKELKTRWIQTRRTTCCTSPEYLDRVEVLLGMPGSDDWRAAYRRIIQRRVEKERRIPAPAAWHGDG